MSSAGEEPAPTDSPPSTPASSSPSTPPKRPLPGAAGEGDDSEVTTTQPPRFTVTSQDPPTTPNAPPTTSNPPAVTTSPPAPARPTTPAAIPHTTTATRPSQPDPSPQDASPSPSPSPAPAASDNPSQPTTTAGPNSPAAASSPLAGVNNIVSPTGAGDATALGASSPVEIVSILAPTTLPDGSTTTIALAPQPVLLTPSASQGFVTATRTKGAQASDGALSPTGTVNPALTPSEKRGRDSAQITGIALGALVIILLTLVFVPKFIRKFKNREKEPSKADNWKPGQTGDRGIGYQKREKEDDEVSWFSGSTTHGDLSEDGISVLEDEKRGMRMRLRGDAEGDDSNFHLVQTLPYQPRSKDNIAGIGRRDTMKSIVQAPEDVPPPQAEFVAMPRTPTIIYSPPPEDGDLAVFRSNPHSHPSEYDTPARRNILTPLTFPTTPSSFPSTPASAIGQNPFSTPPLSGLYSSSEWQHILATPPDHTHGASPSPPPSVRVAESRTGRRRSTLPPSALSSPNLSHCAPPSSYNETESIYSRRSSIPSPSSTSTFFQPSQLQLLRNLRRQQGQQADDDAEEGIRQPVDGIWPSEVRLEGLAKAAARLGGREPSLREADEDELEQEITLR
ncbi:uncharacterized protein JCM15063_001902 [Sporobolomyces koalae]|uniref:uncharacterized protein n=1 Tax=Sporobolomyces koalae TaxID=500713 RepID=UPI003174A8FC